MVDGDLQACRQRHRPQDGQYGSEQASVLSYTTPSLEGSSLTPSKKRAKASRLDNAANVGERLQPGLCENCVVAFPSRTGSTPKPDSHPFTGARITLNY